MAMPSTLLARALLAVALGGCAGASPRPEPIGDPASLLTWPGVVMVGETRDARGRPAILVGVESASDLAGLPAEIDGRPIVKQVIGQVDAI